MTSEAPPTRKSSAYPGIASTLRMVLQGALVSLAYSFLVCIFTWLSYSAVVFDGLRFLLMTGWLGVLGLSAVLVLIGMVAQSPGLLCRAGGVFAGAMLLLAGGTGLGTGWAVDRWRIVRMTVRGAPVVAAIKQYESEHGVPPGDLKALVPKYLPAGIPDPCLGKEREFRYSRATSESPDWLLDVESPWPRLLGPDSIQYTPNGRYYPSADYDIIAGWAYIPE